MVTRNSQSLGSTRDQYTKTPGGASDQEISSLLSKVDIVADQITGHSSPQGIAHATRETFRKLSQNLKVALSRIRQAASVTARPLVDKALLGAPEDLGYQVAFFVDDNELASSPKLTFNELQTGADSAVGPSLQVIADTAGGDTGAGIVIGGLVPRLTLAGQSVWSRIFGGNDLIIATGTQSSVGVQGVTIDSSEITDGLVYIGRGVALSSSSDNRVLTLSADVSSPISILRITQANAGGDAALNFDLSGEFFAIGIDSDKFKVSNEATLGTNDRLVIDTAGVVTMPGNQLSLAVYKSSNQSINDSTVTSITWEVEEWDDGFSHSTSSSPENITIPVAGVYIISTYVHFAASASGTVRRVHLYINGSEELLFALETDGLDNRLRGTAIHKFAASDVVTIRVFQDTGGALNVIGTAGRVNTRAEISLLYAT